MSPMYSLTRAGFLVHNAGIARNLKTVETILFGRDDVLIVVNDVNGASG